MYAVRLVYERPRCPENQRLTVSALTRTFRLAHFYDPETPEHSEIARMMEEKFVHSPMGSGVFRTREQLLELFPDQELIPPGLALCDEWWPDGPRVKPLNQVEECIAGAVGRKL